MRNHRTKTKGFWKKKAPTARNAVLAIAILLVASWTLAACGSARTDDAATSATAAATEAATAAAQEAATTAEATTAASATTAAPEGITGAEEAAAAENTAAATATQSLVTIENFNESANYQGIQPGWFGKILKDKFGIEVNIIAPQVSGNGDMLFQTRAASGYLGDLLTLSKTDFQACVNAGLVMDISDVIWGNENLMPFKGQIEFFNSTLENNAGGAIWGIPAQMADTSPTTFSGTLLSSAPRIPWGYYTELGAPEIATIDDFLEVLAQIQANHPTNSAGEPAYTIELWPDWDNENGMENVVQLTTWYGYETKGSVLVGGDGDVMPVTSDDGAYKKILKFYFDANQKGLVDPDSGTQDWSSVQTKLESKRVLLTFYNWIAVFMNTLPDGEAKTAWTFVPVEDMHFFQLADAYYGIDSVWAIGAGTDAEKVDRIMQMFNWMASEEGGLVCPNALEGFTYEILPDGGYAKILPAADTALNENTPVPSEYGEGGFRDGMNQMQQGINASPRFDTTTWPAEVERNKTATTIEFAEKYGVANEAEYVEAHNMVTSVPNINMTLPADSTDIALIRSQCKELIVDTSWQMVFASDEAEFERMWADLKSDLGGLGFDDLVAWDTSKQQILIDARNAVQK